MSLRTPLSRVLGLGSAKEGVHHWWAQRMTAVALVALTVWFVIALLNVGELDYSTMKGWLEEPLNCVLMILLVIALTYHSQLGIQVVVEDYVANKGAKVLMLIANNFLHFALGASGIFALLSIAFGRAA